MRLEGGGKAAERAAGTRGWESGGHGIAESSGCGGESGEGGGNLSRI